MKLTHWQQQLQLIIIANIKVYLDILCICYVIAMYMMQLNY